MCGVELFGYHQSGVCTFCAYPRSRLEIRKFVLEPRELTLLFSVSAAGLGAKHGSSPSLAASLRPTPRGFASHTRISQFTEQTPVKPMVNPMVFLLLQLGEWRRCARCVCQILRLIGQLLGKHY